MLRRYYLLNRLVLGDYTVQKIIARRFLLWCCQQLEMAGTLCFMSYCIKMCGVALNFEVYCLYNKFILHIMVGAINGLNNSEIYHV